MIMDTTITDRAVFNDLRCKDCLLRSYHALFRKFNITGKVRNEFLNAFDEIAKTQHFGSTPEMQHKLNGVFRTLSGIADAFEAEKAESNRVAEMLYETWQPRVTEAPDPFSMALRLSIAGNIMDYGAADSFDIHKTIENVMNVSFAIDHSAKLKQKLQRAASVLYLGDNAGEIVFDRLLLETVAHPNVSFTVRGGPALNDVTLKEAEETGIHRVAKVIDSGFDAPSTILKKSSHEFRDIFRSADLIISKGQGNLEGLIDENDPRIFFLLMIKCDVMAEKLEVNKGSFIVLNQRI